MIENRSVTLEHLIAHLIHLRDAQGWGDVEVVVDDRQHGCCGPLALTNSATYYPASVIQLGGRPNDRPVIMLKTNGGWQ